MTTPEVGLRHICLLGGGIMSITTAYYLLTDPALPSGTRVTLVENSRRGIAAGASSYAAGFLAGGEDAWQAPPSQDLARLSWKCHVQLAKKLGGADAWGFRECTSVGLRVGGGSESRSAYRLLPGGKKEVLEDDWLVGEREDLTGRGGMGQVEPALFCQALFAHCTTLGLETVYGEPTSLSPFNSKNPTRTLEITPHSSEESPIVLTADSFLVAAGPWSAALCAKLSLPPIPLTNLPGHSIILRPRISQTSHLPAEAIFAGISGAAVGVHASTSGAARSLTLEELGDGYTRSPEAFTRPNGLVYVAGENSIPRTEGVDVGLPNRLPLSADGVAALLDQGLIARLVNASAAISPALNVANGAVVEKAQFCYRPITPDGEPMLGELQSGVFIACGHGPWGITLAPGTGKVMSELLLAKPNLSADISALSPIRFTKIKAGL
ncbi:hypothetical protein P7C70_g3487, partial [Phenoliferia sp. Uapishka_3]